MNQQTQDLIVALDDAALYVEIRLSLGLEADPRADVFTALLYALGNLPPADYNHERAFLSRLRSVSMDAVLNRVLAGTTAS